MVLVPPPVSAHRQGASSTVTCRCPTRGETWLAASPNNGRMRKFSVRYGMRAAPRASGPGSGASTISLGAGSFLIGKNTGGLPASPALWARAPVASTATAAAVASVLMSVVIAASRLDPIGIYVDVWDGPRRP